MRTPLLLCLAMLAGNPAAAMEHAESDTSTHNVFWSGHSLTAPPIPQMLASISSAAGVPMQWNQHTMAGGSMEARTRGRPPNPNGWDGYRQGDNRDGSNLDVIAEFKRGGGIGGEPYHTLIITEVHSFLYALLREDTVRLTRHYHERFIDGNANGRTWLYQAWLDVIDKADPQSWIDYERAAAPVWQCVAARINTSLAAEGRDDRIEFIPASLALIALVEAATGDGVPGITAADTTATLDTIFRDAVHLTDTGSYYISLVVRAFMTGESPVGIWAPADMPPAQARRMQEIAWDFYQSYDPAAAAMTLPECSAFIRDSFAADFWEFELSRQLTFNIPWHEKAVKTVTKPARVRRTTAEWQAAFADDSPENPFVYDAATDADYWHPAP